MKIILSILIFTFLIFNSGCLLNDTEKYIEDLKSANVMVKKNAIYYLGDDEEKRAVPMLIELLNNDSSKEIKLSVTEALGKIGEVSSVDSLVLLLREKDKEIRIAAIEALGKLQDPKAVKPLIHILDDKNDRDIELTAIWALGNTGDKSAIPALTKLLDDKDKYLRYNASQALKEITSGE